MKNRITLILTISLTMFFAACKKDSTIKNSGIVGKWKFVEQYDSYLNGRTFTWNTIAYDDSNTLTFSQNGELLPNF